MVGWVVGTPVAEPTRRPNGTSLTDAAYLTELPVHFPDVQIRSRKDHLWLCSLQTNATTWSSAA